MKNASAIVCFAILITIALGCSNFQRNDSTATGNATNTKATAESARAAKDISGEYSISGVNENGAGAYSGTLAVTNRGDVYQFSWDTAGKKYDGVGVQTGDSIGAAFAEGANGKGCGVVLYAIAEDGTLDGKAGYWGNNNSETETAKRTSGTDLEGDYDITGTNTEGQDYKGKLAVKKAGAGYAFSWKAGSPLEGFGIRQANTVAVGIGGSKCGFVTYERRADGTLEGKWGGYGSRSVGTETAMKK